jgi:hypothetical protein
MAEGTCVVGTFVEIEKDEARFSEIPQQTVGEDE